MRPQLPTPKQRQLLLRSLYISLSFSLLDLTLNAGHTIKLLVQSLTAHNLGQHVLGLNLADAGPSPKQLDKNKNNRGGQKPGGEWECVSGR